MTVVFDLTIAIEIGLLLAGILFVKRIMDVSEISVLENELIPSSDSENPAAADEKLTIPPSVEVYEINGPFFFGIANKFDESMRNIGDMPKVRIFRMRKVPFIDATGMHNLESLCKKSRKEDIRIILSGVRPNVREELAKANFGTLIGEENICDNIYAALDTARQIVGKEGNIAE
jgi:SulP family sulfate permease